MESKTFTLFNSLDFEMQREILSWLNCWDWSTSRLVNKEMKNLCDSFIVRDKVLPTHPEGRLNDPTKKTEWIQRGGCDGVSDDTQYIVFDNFNNDTTWDNFVKLPKSIEILYLSHDGIIFEGKTGAIKRTLQHLTNLKEVHYCGYYSQFWRTLEDAISELDRDIKVVAIE